MGDNAYFRAPIKWLNEDETVGVCVASYVRGGHGLCVDRRFVRNRTGESTLSQHASATMWMVIYRGREGRGGGGGDWRVEPGGKGCAIIRSLRGGMHSVVETLSLRIQAEPPNRGRTDREHLYHTQVRGGGVLLCDLRLILPVTHDRANER